MPGGMRHMAVNEHWGRQLRAALRAYEERHDGERLSWAEIGRRVGARLGREPFASQTAGAWFKDGQEPESFAVAAALADVLEADPGALAFGERRRKDRPTGALPVPPDPELDRKLTGQERANHDALVAAQPKRRPKQRGAGGE